MTDEFTCDYLKSRYLNIYFHHAFLQRGKFPCKTAFNKISHCVFQDHSTVIKEKHSCTCVCSNKNGPIDFIRLFVFVVKLWFFNHRAAIVIIMNWEATFEYLFLNRMCLLKTVGEFFVCFFTVCVRWICSTCSKVTLTRFQSNFLGDFQTLLKYDVFFSADVCK